MALFTSVDRTFNLATRRIQFHDASQAIYRAGEEGLAWRVRCGVVRLDASGQNGKVSFASLAIAGDILGCETLLFGAYTFSATALNRCELLPWPEGEPADAGESLLESLAHAQWRSADIVALRGGQAIDRVLSLIRLFSDEAGKVVLPSRQDIADITDLRFETISRIVKGLERAGVLAAVRIEGVYAKRSYVLDPGVLRSMSSAGRQKFIPTLMLPG